MNRLNIENKTYEKTTIKIDDHNDGLIIYFNGEMDSQNPEPIFSPYFNEIHDKIIENNIKKINLDFSKLTFMNSGGIKTLIKWINKIINSPDDKKYEVLIKVRAAISWQEASLRMLSRLSPSLIKIKVT